MTTKHRIAELFGKSILDDSVNWKRIVNSQECPFTSTTCYKIRKSDPQTSIGTCIVRFKRERIPLIICPKRFLADGQIFADCQHLLMDPQPGDEVHLVPEIPVPGGSVDYFMILVRQQTLVDFVGIEIQALDTTGTVWPYRQRFLKEVEALDDPVELENKPMGINWKMTSKTILMQLHHKIGIFESLGRKLVLVLQQDLMDYMANEFTFDHFNTANKDDAMHFHSYQLILSSSGESTLTIEERKSTNSVGLSRALSLAQDGTVTERELFERIRRKIHKNTLLYSY